MPGIRAVIDSGLARISRYSPRSRLQRLPIEPVSRASAEQRKGRCGRIGAGLCVRLYSQEEFESRPEFTEPEVLRTNLAALLLRLAADGLGEAETFPFIDRARIARTERRLSLAAGARGVGRRAAHHRPRAGDGAPAAGSAARTGAAREQRLPCRKRVAGARRGIERAGCAHLQAEPEDPGEDVPRRYSTIRSSEFSGW